MRLDFWLVALITLVSLPSLDRRTAQSEPSAPDQQTPQAVSPPGEFREWQVLDTRSGRPVSLEDLTTTLGTSQVIYLGEEHRNRSHVEAALNILNALLAKGRQPVLAVEMFSWDGQDALDRYLSDQPITRDQFLKESHWEQSWGGPFEDYEPLIILARDRHLAVLALNPPRALVRRVATVGLSQALVDPEMRRWGMEDEQFPGDPGYREKILRQLRLCHSGLSEEAYERMYEASVFRDEAMAKTISDHLRSMHSGIEPQARPIVTYTGSGHIQYRLPVPNRVARRHGGAIRQVTIYMTAYEPSRTQEIQELMREPIADYLWLTPVGAEGLPKRCR